MYNFENMIYQRLFTPGTNLLKTVRLLKKEILLLHDRSGLFSDTSLIESNDEDEGMGGGPPMRSSSPPRDEQQPQAKPGRMAKMEERTGGSDDGGAAAVLVGYNAAEFKHLNVSDDIRELFKHIGRYQVGVSVDGLSAEVRRRRLFS